MAFTLKMFVSIDRVSFLSRQPLVAVILNVVNIGSLSPTAFNAYQA